MYMFVSTSKAHTIILRILAIFQTTSFGTLLFFLPSTEIRRPPMTLHMCSDQIAEMSAL